MIAKHEHGTASIPMDTFFCSSPVFNLQLPFRLAFKDDIFSHIAQDALKRVLGKLKLMVKLVDGPVHCAKQPKPHLRKSERDEKLWSSQRDDEPI